MSHEAGTILERHDWVIDRPAHVETRTFWSTVFGARLISESGFGGRSSDIDLAGFVQVNPYPQAGQPVAPATARRDGDQPAVDGGVQRNEVFRVTQSRKLRHPAALQRAYQRLQSLPGSTMIVTMRLEVAPYTVTHGRPTAEHSAANP